LKDDYKAPVGRKKSVVAAVPLSRSILQFLSPLASITRDKVGSISLSKRPPPPLLLLDAPPAKRFCFGSRNQPILAGVSEKIPSKQVLVEEVQEETDLDTLFVWLENSCSYDTLLSPLYYVYKRKLNKSERASFPEAIKSLFDMAIQAETTMAATKVQLMAAFFYEGSEFIVDTIQTLENVVDHWLQWTHVNMSNETTDMCYMRYNLTITCKNVECDRGEEVVEDFSHSMHLTASTDPAACVQYLMDRLWAPLESQQVRSYFCLKCESRMECKKKITGRPLIIFIAFSAVPHFEIDLVVIWGGDTYDLVVVTYYGNSHYIARVISEDGLVLEYDGMKRLGKLAAVLGPKVFNGVIIDLSNKRREVNGAWYKKRRS
jgi:hypothetical protein